MARTEEIYDTITQALELLKSVKNSYGIISIYDNIKVENAIKELEEIISLHDRRE